MSNVEEARNKFFEAKKAVASCQSSIAELQRKCDTLQESLPGLTRAVEDAEKAKVAALDCFALSSNKQTESALKAARQAHEAAQKKLTETHELIEAVGRALKRQESELVRLNNLCELSNRECWQAIAEEIKNNIPAHIFEAIKTLLVAGVQCCMTRQFILDNLFPNIPSGEFQAIRGELCEKYNID